MNPLHARDVRIARGQKFSPHTLSMTNLAYTGNAGSQSFIRTTAYRAAAAPLILIIEDHLDSEE